MSPSIFVLAALVLATCAAPVATRAAQDAVVVPRFDYSLHHSAAIGCGDVFFHAVNAARTEILRIEADAAKLGRHSPWHDFDLARLPAGVVVEVAVYRTREINRPNCSDIVVSEIGRVPEQPQVWRPVRGRLRVERGRRGARPEEPWLFSATLRLVDAAFRGPDGRVVAMGRPFTWKGFVGWQAG